MVPIIEYQNLLPLIVIVLTFIVPLNFLIFKSKRNTKKWKLPPSPPKLPIIGNLHQLSTYPQRSFTSLSKTYGDLMFLRLGSLPFLVVSSARAASEILKKHDAVFANRPSSRTSRMVHYGGKNVSGAPYGEYWRKMKNICVFQLFSSKSVRSFRSIREEETALMMAKIRQASESSTPVNLSKMLISLTIDVICRVAFHKKYSDNHIEGGTNFKWIVDKSFELVGTVKVGDLIPWLGWLNRLDGWDAKLRQVFKELDQFLDEVIEEHLQIKGTEQGINASSNDSEKLKKDLVDVLLDIQKDNTDGFSFGRDNIKGLIMDIFTGASETTASTLEWAMTELLRHPRVMQELQKEVRGITKDKCDVDEEDLEQMKYLKAVIKETLRLHPPIPLIPRLSTQDLEIDGYEIPSGTSVFINVWAIQRDSACWDKPDEFNPDRFRDSGANLKEQDMLQFVPFGAGKRVCPGALFAGVNVEIVLANLMHKFDWSLPGGAKGDTLDMSETLGLGVHRKTPLLAVASARY